MPECDYKTDGKDEWCYTKPVEHVDPCNDFGSREGTTPEE